MSREFRPDRSKAHPLRHAVLAVCHSGGFRLLVGWCLLFLVSAYAMLSVFPVENTDVDDYAEIRAGLLDDGVAHFPAWVPAGASDVRMAYQRGMGGHFQLRMTLATEHVEAIEGSLDPVADVSMRPQIFVGDDFPYAPSDDVPPGYEEHLVYVEGREPNGYWNHGAASGVILSRATGDIIYWAHWW